MKTTIKATIKNDYNSEDAYKFWKDDIRYFINLLDVNVIQNNINYQDSFNDKTKAKEDYKNKKTINAIGYSKGDYLDYIIYYNKVSKEQKEDFKQLKTLLSRAFTHKNNYKIKTKEVLTIDGKIFETENTENFYFVIDYIEFPNKEDIEKESKNIIKENLTFDKLIITLK
jgi:hypothetical protein